MFSQFWGSGVGKEIQSVTGFLFLPGYGLSLEVSQWGLIVFEGFHKVFVCSLQESWGETFTRAWSERTRGNGFN